MRKITQVFARRPQIATIIFFVILCAFFGIMKPTFFSVANLTNIVNQSAVTCFIGFAMTMVLLTAGIDLSVGGVLALVCIGVAMMLNAGISPLVATLLGLLIGIAIGALNGLLITVFNIQPFLITMGMVNISRGFAKYITDGKSIFIKNDAFRAVFSQSSPLGLPILLFWIAGTLIFTYILISKTPFGRQIQAVGGNAQAALLSGVKVKTVKVIVYSMAGLFAALAGIVTLSRLSSGLSTVGNGIEMDGIAASVLGGTGFAGEGGNVFGTLIGAFVLGVIINGLTLMGINSYLQDVIKGIIIIFTVVFSVSISKKK